MAKKWQPEFRRLRCTQHELPLFAGGYAKDIALPTHAHTMAHSHTASYIFVDMSYKMQANACFYLQVSMYAYVCMCVCVRVYTCM